MSTRFVPISFEKPKALIEVKGEILIERQIKQLLEANINDIYIVVGYMYEKFTYLEKKFGVKLIYNNEYKFKNNISSIWSAKEVLGDSFVCSADNYFVENPFLEFDDNSYYSVAYCDGKTKEWCVETDDNDVIVDVSMGGQNSWYMIGHTFWNKDFSKKFIEILNENYEFPETYEKLWEKIYIENLEILKMKIKKFPDNYIFEFDTLDELREFDSSYIINSKSMIIKRIVNKLNTFESNLVNFNVLKNEKNIVVGFTFNLNEKKYKYIYEKNEVELI